MNEPKKPGLPPLYESVMAEIDQLMGVDPTPEEKETRFLRALQRLRLRMAEVSPAPPPHEGESP